MIKKPATTPTTNIQPTPPAVTKPDVANKSKKENKKAAKTPDTTKKSSLDKLKNLLGKPEPKPEPKPEKK